MNSFDFSQIGINDATELAEQLSLQLERDSRRYSSELSDKEER